MRSHSCDAGWIQPVNSDETLLNSLKALNCQLKIKMEIKLN